MDRAIPPAVNTNTDTPSASESVAFVRTEENMTANMLTSEVQNVQDSEQFLSSPSCDSSIHVGLEHVADISAALNNDVRSAMINQITELLTAKLNATFSIKLKHLTDQIDIIKKDISELKFNLGLTPTSINNNAHGVPTTTYNSSPMAMSNGNHLINNCVEERDLSYPQVRSTYSNIQDINNDVRSEFLQFKQQINDPTKFPNSYDSQNSISNHEHSSTSAQSIPITVSRENLLNSYPRVMNSVHNVRNSSFKTNDSPYTVDDSSNVLPHQVMATHNHVLPGDNSPVNNSQDNYRFHKPQKSMPIHKWPIKFSGISSFDDPNSTKWNEFLKRIARLMKSETASEMEVFERIEYLLSGPALKWYYAYLHKMKSWKDFVFLFKRQYQQEDHDERTLMQIYERYQGPEESPFEYLHEMISLFEDYPFGLDERRRVFHILRGFREEIRLAIGLHQPKTVDTIVSLIHSMERQNCSSGGECYPVEANQ